MLLICLVKLTPGWGTTTTGGGSLSGSVWRRSPKKRIADSAVDKSPRGSGMQSEIVEQKPLGAVVVTVDVDVGAAVVEVVVVSGGGKVNP